MAAVSTDHAEPLTPERLAQLDALGQRIGHRFGNLDLLDLALRHRSWCAEHGGAESNERLEFLGDAVLGLCVSELLGRTRPEADEGALTRMRSALVNAEALARWARADGGLVAAAPVVLRLLGPLAEQVVGGAAGTDFKSRLQELAAQRYDQVPRYELEEAGPDHDKWFQATVSVGGEVAGSGGGRSKKQAEQAAAEQAWQQMSGAAVVDEIANGGAHA